MKAVAKCVAGRIREKNEDAIYISGENDIIKDLFIIADGMGGHNAGEVASKTAIDSFLEYLTSTNKMLSNDNCLDILVEGINHSNSQIYEKSTKNKDYTGMGTTFLCVAIKDNKLYSAHVGDCRAYVYRKKELVQLTKDHTLVMEMVRQGRITLEEAAVHPSKNIITRALGTKVNVEIDTVVENIVADDIILMCSDGLYNMLSDYEIEDILGGEMQPSLKVEKLVEKANENGGVDNISAIIIQQEVRI